jgi:hypothetical protein
MIPTTYISLHDVTGLKAAALQTLDTPLMLTIDTPLGSMQISLYFTGIEAMKIEHLAGSINAVLRAPDPPKVACPQEEAAYNAADTYMASLIRDLNRDPIEVPK